MPRCAWCNERKLAAAFGQSAGGMLRVVCMVCEKQPLTYCGFCGLPIMEGRYYKISDRLHECQECHEQTQEIIRKNTILRIRKQIIQVTRQTTNMSEHLIGDLRSKLFDTIDGLMAGTVTAETAAQITDVARAIIDSAKVENEFVKLTGTNGSGFIPVLEGPVKDRKQIGPGKSSK